MSSDEYLARISALRLQYDGDLEIMKEVKPKGQEGGLASGWAYFQQVKEG